jgi:hypothetical protein
MIQKIVDKIKSCFSNQSSQERLESYIISHNPKNLCDIERLTEEFERRCFLQGNCKL